MTKIINFDMDGTIADLYGVENWLKYLQEENTKPYAEAKPLVNLSVLARQIHRLQKKGYTINVISWLAKNGSEIYNEKVAETKKEWLKKHLPSVQFDNVYITKYGIPKSKCAKGILFDDEEQNRKEWSGIALDEKNLLNKLRVL